MNHPRVFFAYLIAMVLAAASTSVAMHLLGASDETHAVAYFALICIGGLGYGAVANRYPP